MSVPLLTLDRVVATAGTFVALGGAISGGLALAGRLRPRGPVIALAAGAVGVVVGVLVLVLLLTAWRRARATREPGRTPHQDTPPAQRVDVG